MAILREAWVAQAAVGCAVAPGIGTRRVAGSITAKTYSVAPVSVLVSKKSARMAWAWERRKVAQVVCWRSGAGSDPWSAATLIPRTASSPWMRRYLQLEFSRASRNTRAGTDRTVRSRPGRLGREAFAWRRRSSSRCQRSTVSRETISGS